MKTKLEVIGNYLNEKTKNTINFKTIKTDVYYKGILFTYMKEDYLITETKEEMLDVLWQMSSARSDDFNKKDAKRYTHTKFKKAKEKNIISYGYKRKGYFIVEL